MTQRGRLLVWVSILAVVAAMVAYVVYSSVSTRRRYEQARKTSMEVLKKMGGQLTIGNRRGDWMVSLYNTNTDDAALAELVATLKYCPVDELHLANTKITDKGLESVAQLRALGYLDIGGTQVTDEGLQHLLSLKNLWRLRRDGTKITEQGFARLLESQPQLELGESPFRSPNKLSK